MKEKELCERCREREAYTNKLCKKCFDLWCKLMIKCSFRADIRKAFTEGLSYSELLEAIRDQFLGHASKLEEEIRNEEKEKDKESTG